MRKNKKAYLVFSDGTVFEGYALGKVGETTGEVVFNTSMSGYQEVLTDPSYRGQIVTMTYTHMGNYGTNPEDVESVRPWVEGFVVKEPCPYPSNWRYEREGKTLDEYLEHWGIVGIWGVDTRAITRHIRERGAMEAVISSVDDDVERLYEKAKALPGLKGKDLVKEVTCSKPYHWQEALWELEGGYKTGLKTRYRVVAYDYGIKLNILRNLVEAGCDVTVVPAWMSADKVLELDPDGIFLSNGPGDPEPVTYAIENIRKLIGKRPIFGICLGHQLLCLALGGRTYKLKFGHHGGNQPVKDLKTGKVEITSQNHGFAVDVDSIKGIAELTHLNLNDHTVEGIAHREYPLFSVQYHPEASPGPHDSQYLFRRFTALMEG